MTTCRSAVVVTSVRFTCGREPSHDGEHRTEARAEFSVADVHFPRRGATELVVSWDAPVELDAAMARECGMDPQRVAERFGLPAVEPPVRDGR
jgi:hypothetical protein